MTVSSPQNKAVYIGNGTAKEFAVPFSFLEETHIKVKQKLNDVQTERSDWEISGGNIVFKTAPESGAEIAIVREVPLTQETDYRDNEILHAETLERNFDKLTMQVQQLAEKSERAVTVDIFDATAADSLIPSIRKAVSDCQTAAAAATANAQTATEQAAAAQTAADYAAASEANTAAMLKTKANVNADNFSSNGKQRLASLGKPYYSNKITIGVQGDWLAYTCPTSGFILITGTNDSNFVQISVNGIEYSSKRGTMLIPVNTGNLITKISSNGTNAAYFVMDIGG